MDDNINMESTNVGPWSVLVWTEYWLEHTAKQHLVNVMNATSKELQGKIEERKHQGKY